MNNNGSLLKIFLQNVIDQEIVDRRRVKLSYEDTAHILFTNPRLGKLKTIIEPKVLQELVDVFTLCRSLKIERDTVQRKYIVGSDQRNRKTTVSYLE